jgi:hypothetical protein
MYIDVCVCVSQCVCVRTAWFTLASTYMDLWQISVLHGHGHGHGIFILRLFVY